MNLGKIQLGDPPQCFGIRGYCSYVKYGGRYNSLLVGRRGTVCRGGAPPHCTMERLEQGQRNFYIFLNPLQGRAAEQTIKLKRFRFFRKTPETDRKKNGNFSGIKGNLLSFQVRSLFSTWPDVISSVVMKCESLTMEIRGLVFFGR